MAKKSAIEKNKSRIKKVEKFRNKRMELKKLIMNKKTSQEDRFEAVMKLSSLQKARIQSMEKEVTTLLFILESFLTILLQEKAIH